MQKIKEIKNYKLDLSSVYSGSDRKIAIIYNNKSYMLKFSTKNSTENEMVTSYVNNVLSEYVSSNIISLLGFPVHNTFLANFEGKLVVACENFLQDDEVLHEFGEFLRQNFDSSEIGRIPDLSQMYKVFNTSLLEIQDVSIKHYWDMFVLDALLGNFDRHKGNWSYIYNLETDKLYPSPIYDCGSTLFPNLSEEGMLKVLDDIKEIEKRIFLFPKAALTVNGAKCSYYDLLCSGYDKNLTKSILDVVPKIDLNKIKDFIFNDENLSDIRKEFYFSMIKLRKEILLDKAYECAKTNEFDIEALSRIEEGIAFDEEMFDELYQKRLIEGKAIKYILPEYLKNEKEQKNIILDKSTDYDIYTEPK